MLFKFLTRKKHKCNCLIFIDINKYPKIFEINQLEQTKLEILTNLPTRMQNLIHDLVIFCSNFIFH